MDIFWTPTAKETYLYIIEYLEEVWGEKYVNKFIKDTEALLKLIVKYPAIYEVISDEVDVRRAIVHKNCSFLYREKSGNIELLVFWDNRQEPFI